MKYNEFQWKFVPMIIITFVLVLIGIYYISQNYSSPISSSNNSTSVLPTVGSPPQKIKLDSNGIPLVYYGNETGYQRNPVTTSRMLMNYSDDFLQTKNLTKLKYLKNNANWLIINEKNYGNYSFLEYNFPFDYNMTSPWRSALAQGFAIQALTKAFKITNNETYLSATVPLLNSFYVDVKNGGITEKTENYGWWYEEYAGNSGENPRVLNGMMYDLVALYDYYNYTGNTKAEFLFRQGVLALVNNIALYDNDGNSYYDSVSIGPAPIFYHKVHIDLLDKLYKITGKPIFRYYHDKWESHLDSQSNNTQVISQGKPLATELKNVRIAIVKATFTGGAYNNAFYEFYDKYAPVWKIGQNITTDLNLLTGTIPNHSVGNYDIWYIPSMQRHLKSTLSGATVTILRDEDIHQGHIFYQNGTNAYNLLILGHQEYVTQEEYSNLEQFVSNGGKIIFLDGNVFYAEVRYDATTNSVTLISGHAWKYDGKVVTKNINERWFNETSLWVGGNFWTKEVKRNIQFTNNIFNYTHFEETYLNNPNDTMILDYGANDPLVKAQQKIATYELDYKKGNVIVIGLYAENIFGQYEFNSFFDSLVKGILSDHPSSYDYKTPIGIP